MHFWIDKRSQANTNQCRANARLTLNRLQPLEYVRPPYHHQHHHNNNNNNNNNNNTYLNSSSGSSSSSNYNYNYPNLNSSNNHNHSYNNNNIILRNLNLHSLNRPNRTIINNNRNSGNQSTNINSINTNMINTAATSSAHSSYRIPHHQNIDIDPTFGPNDAHNLQEPVRQQPHLRWQVLVVFTFFVVTIRFYVLGNRSEVLIYCISGLILVMALLIFSALNLQKKLTNGPTNCNTTSPRFDGVQHTRLINTNNRLGGVLTTTNTVNQQHHPEQIATNSRCPYVQQLVLQNITGSLGRNGTNRDAQILAEAVVLLPPSPTHILQNHLDIGRHHSESSIAPPSYDKAILLPSNNKNKKLIGIEIESSEDETPPPSYAAVTDINN